MKRPVLVGAIALALFSGGELFARRVRVQPAVEHPWGHPWLPRDARNYTADERTYFRLRTPHPEHSAQGLRERRTYAVLHPGVDRVLVLGEAEAYGTQVRFEDTWPRALERLLAEDPLGTSAQAGADRRRAAEVVNAAIPVHSSPLHVRRLPELLTAFRPEVVVLDVGATDVVARLRYADFQSDHSHMYRPFVEPRTPLWRKSVLCDGLARRLGFGFEHQPSIHAVAQVRERGELAQNLAASSVEAFRAHLVQLVELVRGAGAVPVLATQASCFAVYPGELDPEAWVTATDELNATIRAVAAAHAVDLADVAAALDGRAELFVDGRRTNHLGQRQRAEVIAPCVAAALQRTGGTR